MKKILNRTLIVALLFGFMSCSLGVSDEPQKLEELKKTIENADDSEPEPVEVSIDGLVGTWKYAEVRTSVNQKGIAPMGEILLGITDEHTLSFATDGVEELRQNLEGVPSSFEIRDNKLCALDMSAEIDFKLNFKSNEVSCYLLNENEMILGKGNETSPMIMYLYYRRVE